MADIPEPIEGWVPEGKYHINRSSFDLQAIEHGWIILQTIDNENEFEVEASFLYFANLEDARNVQKNLLRLKGERFLRSHFIIARKEGIWVAVEKIEYSLEDYKNLHRLSLDNPEARLPQNYRLIIRDIIIGMSRIHKQNLIHGNLSSKDIMIIKDRAKFGFITNRYYDSGDSDFTKLKEIFADVLGRDRIPNHVELMHFHESAKPNHWRNLQKLYFHPLLMSSGERFLLPVRADTRLRYRKAGIQQQISNFKKLFHTEPEWRIVVSSRQDCYLKVLQGRAEEIERAEEIRYHEDAWALFKFVRNAIVHINENIHKENERRRKQEQEERQKIKARIRQLKNQRDRKNKEQELWKTLKAATYLEIKTETAVEEELSSMFPYFLTKVYDLLSPHEITPSIWMPFLED